MKSRNSNLDALRGILCIMIFMGHYYFPEFSDSQIDWIRAYSGGNAVTAWFMLSGFTAVYYDKGKIPQGNVIFGGTGYFWNRVRKIYPVYIIALLFSLVAIPIDR